MPMMNPLPVNNQLLELGRKWIDKWNKAKEEAAQAEFESFWQAHVSNVNQKSSSPTKLLQAIHTKLDMVAATESARKAPTVDWRSATLQKASGTPHTKLDQGRLTKIQELMEEDVDWSLTPEPNEDDDGSGLSLAADDSGGLSLEGEVGKSPMERSRQPINKRRGKRGKGSAGADFAASIGFPQWKNWENISKKWDAWQNEDDEGREGSDSRYAESQGRGEAKSAMAQDNGDLIAAIKDLTKEITKLLSTMESAGQEVGPTASGGFKPGGPKPMNQQATPASGGRQTIMAGQLPTMAAVTRIMGS